MGNAHWAIHCKGSNRKTAVIHCRLLKPTEDRCVSTTVPRTWSLEARFSRNEVEMEVENKFKRLVRLVRQLARNCIKI